MELSSVVTKEQTQTWNMDELIPRMPMGRLIFAVKFFIDCIKKYQHLSYLLVIF